MSIRIVGTFLSVSLALFVSGCVSDLIQVVDDVRVDARIGLLAHTEIGPKNLGTLEKALRYYRQCKVDAVVLTGCVVKDGAARTCPELEALWQKVFAETETRLIVDDGRMTVNGFTFAVSSKRPLGLCDVLTFYAGRKLPLTDDLCYYPRAAKAICVGSMRGVEVPEVITDKELRAAAAKAAQGLLVSVYSDHAVVRRLDFTQSLPLDRDQAWHVKKSRLVYAEDVAEPWVIGPDTPSDPQGLVPRFWDDAQIFVQPGYKDNSPICTVKWPNVTKSGTGVRARWYEVGVAFADAPDKFLKMRTVLSGGFFLSEDRDKSGVKTVFAMKDLPRCSEKHPEIVFSVTPVGPTGKHGKTVRSRPVPLLVK